MSNSVGSTLIHLAGSFATLLSGDLSDCQNATDPTCFAGAAAVSAYWRPLTEPKFLLPQVDLYSPFVQMHPDEWAINRVVLHDYFNYTVMASPPSLLTNQGIVDTTTGANSGEVKAAAQLQSKGFPLLVSNVALPPYNSWQPFVETVHFDEETRIAMIAIVPEGKAIFVSQIQSAKACLDYIARLNSDIANSDAENSEQYWVPVITFGQLAATVFTDFLEAVVSHVHPPLLLLDIEANAGGEYAVPTKVLGRTWVCSYQASWRYLHRFEIQVEQQEDQDNQTGERRLQQLNRFILTNVTLVIDDLSDVQSVQDEQYTTDILYLRSLAEIAFRNDPIVGYSGFMPLTRNDGNIRLCMGGECPIGNLFTDALRWYTNADLAFITSGGVRGPGWEEGPVRVRNIWDALPFANTVCTGSILGVHLFEVFNYSTSMATFLSTFTDTGDELMQVSGARYTYNAQLNTSRLIHVDIYDSTTKSYQPLDRLRLYTFATDSYLCGISRPFRDFLTTNLDFPNEIPGAIDADGLTHQLVVGEYMNSLEIPYNTTMQGRLVNDTTAMEPLDFVQTEEGCQVGTGKTWDAETESCIECPNGGEKVRFVEQELEFEMVLGNVQRQEQQVELINLQTFPVRLVSKIVPSWMEVDISLSRGITLESGESFNMSIAVIDLPTIEAGTSLGSVVMRVQDGGKYPGCNGNEITLDALVRVVPQENMNQLGNFRYIGFTFSVLVWLTAVSFALWVIKNRQERIVKTLQPPFLIQICMGITWIAGSLTTLSIDDEIMPLDLVDKACMATPWFMGIGVTFTFSALVSKLWRINKLFAAQFRRIRVRERDVMWPFLVLLALNLTFLVVWTVLDPLRWVREEINGQAWNTYGQCRGEGIVSETMMGLIVGVNAIALLLACWQAYKARGISDDFSESKYIGIAVFSWVQVLAVGFPVLFLIDKEDTQTVYFLQVAIISVICMSMLVLVFVPMMVHLYRFKKSGRNNHVTVTGVASRESHVVARARASIVGTVPMNYGGSRIDSSMDNDLINLGASDPRIFKDEIVALRSRISQLEQKNVSLMESNNDLVHISDNSDVENGRSAES